MRLAYDVKLKRPGCVLLQAGMGGEPHLAHFFDSSEWLLGPTDDLKVYELTREQFNVLVAAHEIRRKFLIEKVKKEGN